MGTVILKKTAYIHTLGCRLNSADSALLESASTQDADSAADSAATDENGETTEEG